MTALKRLPIRFKMALGPLSIFLIMAAVSSYTFTLMSDNERDVIRMRDGLLQATTRATDLSASIETINGFIYRLTSIAANETDESKVERIAKDVSAFSKNFEASFGDSRGTFVNVGLSESILVGLDGAFAAYVKSTKSVIDMAAADAGTALMLMGSVDRNAAKLRETMGGIVSELKGQRDHAFEEIIEQGHKLLLAGIWALVATLVATGIITWIMGRLIASPIGAMTVAMDSAANGNLKARTPGLDRVDEIGAMARALEGFKVTSLESLRSSVALNSLRSHVMICNSDGNLVFVSDGIRELLSGHRNAISQ